MISGQKKWWFFPPSQTPYLKPSINVNGFSAHTRTYVGKKDMPLSPWLNKLERYTTIVNPGDVLVNPPWFWHAIINQGDYDSHDLIIGCPSRYGQGKAFGAAFRSNFLFSLNSHITFIRKFGWKALTSGFKMNLQGGIANNRRDRENLELNAEEDMDLAE